MTLENLPHLTPANHVHLREMMEWFPDAESTRIWGGPAFVFPFDEKSFAMQVKLDELPSYALVMPSGALCGFGQYYLRSGRCHLGRLVIAPSFRRRGLGIRLVEMLMETGTRALGVNECSLFVLMNTSRWDYMIRPYLAPSAR